MPSTWVNLVWLWYWKTKRKYFSSCHRTIINPLGGLFRLKCSKASYTRVTVMHGFDERIFSIPVSSLYYYFIKDYVLQWCRLKIDCKVTLLKNFLFFMGFDFSRSHFRTLLSLVRRVKSRGLPSKCSPDPVLLNFSVRMGTGVSNIAWSADKSLHVIQQIKITFRVD